MNFSYSKLDGSAWRVLGVTVTVAMFLAVSCVLFLIPSNAQGMTSNQKVDEDSAGAPYAAGELLVTFKPEVSSSGTEKVQKEIGAKG